MQVGEALRLLRTINGLSQKQLAEELDLSDSYISELERDNRDPSLSVIERYAEFFEIPPSAILMFAEDGASGGNNTSSSKRIVADNLIKIMKFASRIASEN